MVRFALLVVLAACGGSNPPPSSPSSSAPDQPTPATGSTAPGGVPGTPDQCCCELTDSRGTQLTSSAECSSTGGTCKPTVECGSTSDPIDPMKD
jgi:hypothetical protein